MMSGFLAASGEADEADHIVSQVDGTVEIAAPTDALVRAQSS